MDKRSRRIGPARFNSAYHKKKDLQMKRKRWRYAFAPFVGILALLWLLFRSGNKPSRIVYPCQQASLSAASLALSAPLVTYLINIFRDKIARLLTPTRIAIAAILLISLISSYSYLSRSNAYTGPVLSPSNEYRAQVFHKIDCSQEPVGDRFLGLEDLIAMMGSQDLKFYQSDRETLTSGSNGILASDDTIVIKINYQWDERGGTNTDVLQGLIREIVDHPDSFTGEIVVCENAQFKESTENFDRARNNAQDISLSPHDVVVHFQSLGYTISHYDWTLIRYDSVTEYALGDARDGYVVYPNHPDFDGCISYPKFQTDYGTKISLKFGIWDESSSQYDREHLKFINVPVLKSHSGYGVTACIKDYMGVVTRELGTNSHSRIKEGILGAAIGEIQLADLNILDCIWINAHYGVGPSTPYFLATRKDMLVASLDPVAADIWADKNILIPAFIENGYYNYPKADPDDPNSDFREYLDNSMNYIIAAGYDVTNNFDQIDLFNLAPPGEASDPEGSGDPFTISKAGNDYFLAWSQPEMGGLTDEYNLYRIALDTIHDVYSPECEAALGTDTSAFLSTLTDRCGFIVVGRNDAGDGSYGQDSQNRERLNAQEPNICP
jgi:hypothetical protein